MKWKRYWWVADLALLTLLAIAASNTALVWIRNRLTPPWHPSLLKEAPARTGKSEGVAAGDGVILQRNLFAAAVEPPSPSQAAGATKAAPPPLNVRLLGTVELSDGEAQAVLEDKTTKRQKLYRRGDRIGSARLVEIERRHVVLVNGGHRETLTLSDAIVTVPSPPRGASASAPGAGSQMIENVGESTWIIDRARVEQAVGNASQYLSNVRVLPYFERGKQAGYLVSRIPPGSLLSRVGLANGDVIRKINGVEISSPEEVFRAYQNISDGDTVTIEIQRNRKLEVFTYIFK